MSRQTQKSHFKVKICDNLEELDTESRKHLICTSTTQNYNTGKTFNNNLRKITRRVLNILFTIWFSDILFLFTLNTVHLPVYEFKVRRRSCMLRVRVSSSILLPRSFLGQRRSKQSWGLHPDLCGPWTLLRTQFRKEAFDVRFIVNTILGLTANIFPVFESRKFFYQMVCFFYVLISSNWHLLSILS